MYSVDQINVQCMRRLIEEKDMKHGFNGFTYFSMLLSVVFQSTFRLRKKMTWKVWALASSVVAALANICWDIRMDWGLLQRNSRNFLLRDKLLLPHKSAYYIAMVKFLSRWNSKTPVSLSLSLCHLSNIFVFAHLMVDSWGSPEICMAATSIEFWHAPTTRKSHNKHICLLGDSSSWHLECL